MNWSAQSFAIVAMMLSMLVYQFSASLAKYLFSVMDPLSVTVLRLIFAAIFVALMLRSWRVLSLFKQLNWLLMLLFTVSLIAMNVMFYAALARLPLGLAVALEFAGPLALALLSISRLRDMIWVLCAAAGIVLMLPLTVQQAKVASWSGILYALGAGVSWACYIYLGQKVARQSIGLHSLTLVLSLGALLILPIGLYQFPAQILNVMNWGYAIALAILATAVPYLLDLYAMKNLGRVQYSTLSSFSPALAALTGWWILHEHLNLPQWLGMILLIIASIGVTVLHRPTDIN